MSNQAIRVAVADHDERFRENVQLYLRAEFDLQLVCITDRASALEDAQKYDVVLIEAQPPFQDEQPGVIVARAIHLIHPEARVILIGADEEDLIFSRIVAMQESGCAGILLREASGVEVAAGIRLAFDGRWFSSRALEQPILREAVDALARQPRKCPKCGTFVDGNGSTLTPREIEVLSLVAEGLTNRLIAKQLNVSEATIKNHLQSIFAKLRTDNRVQAAMIAFQRGVIPLPEKPHRTS